MNTELQELQDRISLLEQERRHDRAQIRRASRRARLSWMCSLSTLALGLLVNVRPAVLAQAPGVTLASLQAAIMALQQKTAPIITSGNAASGYQMTISKANVQIVNGLGSTETQNGLGNLIVGYNETRDGSPFGTDARTGSHNIVTGELNNYTSSGGILGGSANSLSGVEEFAVGTVNNVAGLQSAVSGGYANDPSGNYSSISGGYSNSATSTCASISGGVENTASAFYASVSGGFLNTAGGASSSVSGGTRLTQSAQYGWTGGSYHTP